MALKICVAGATGRMGRMILAALVNAGDMQAVAALTHPQSAHLGSVIEGVTVSTDSHAAIAACDVLIDFSTPADTLENLALCVALNKPAVVGTTGLNAPEYGRLQAYSTEIPIVFSANMSLGVNVLQKLVALAAKALHEQYDIEIIEAHHNKKVDAPSGTALMLGNAAAAAIDTALKDVAVYARVGQIGPRTKAEIGFSTIRGGDIIGDHTVMFAGPGERIELIHRSQSRSTYAQGALSAAAFVAGKPAGLYSMADVLGL